MRNPFVQPVGRVVFLTDKRNWAFDFVARSIACRLAPKWHCKIAYANEQPHLNARDTDLLYIFFWGESSKHLGFKKEQVIKEVASYRWMTEDRFGRLTPPEFVSRYLGDAQIITMPSASLCRMLQPLRENVFHCPNGIEPFIFNACGRKRGEFTLVWAGSANDPGKGLYDIIIPAIGSDYQLMMATGGRSRREMRRLYRSADVILVASGIGKRNDAPMESQPLPLIEAMACGCFPVTTNVGIVPELVKDGFNGLVLPERTPKEMRNAVDWCAENIDYVRAMGNWNAAYIGRYRSWNTLAQRFDEILSYALFRKQSGAEKNTPDTFAEHVLPDKDIDLQPAFSNYSSGKIIDTTSLLFNDYWNSLQVVRFFSKTINKIHRSVEAGDLFEKISKIFHSH